MSRRFQFETPTAEQARQFLAERAKAIRGDKTKAAFLMAESYRDALACVRALQPVIDPRERKE